MIEEQDYQRMLAMENQQKAGNIQNIQENMCDQFFREYPNFIHIPLHKSKFQIHLLLYYITLLQSKLPNMPYKYLLNTVLSPSHQTILLLNYRQLLGGLTFNGNNGKCELLLMASSESKKGHGTKIIHQLIVLSQKRRIHTITTQADNTALDFYKKVGFSIKKIGLKQENQVTNATLMTLRINFNLDYLKMKQKIKLQKQYITSAMEVNQQLRYINGSQLFIRGERFRMNPDRLLLNNFWHQYKLLANGKHQINYQQYIHPINRLIAIAVPQLIEATFTNQTLALFQYSKPIDLQTIKKKALANKYLAKQQLWNDFKKLLQNCTRFYKGNQKINDNIEVLAKQLQRIKNDS